MKTLKLVITTLFVFAVSIGFAQKVDYGGVTYLVKGNSIFMDKIDITNTLSYEEQAGIKNALSQQILAEKKLKEAERAQKKAEKAQRKAEKKQKAAEKKIKKAETAKKKYEDAQSKYEKELKKYQKLQFKGKLSPEDEIKWQKKLAGLKANIEKLKNRL
jgi:hypothetical protein